MNDLTDGEWHRLHPATPLLRGGIILIAVLGFVLSNFRERLVEWVFGAPDLPGDPLQTAYERGQIGWAAVIVAAVLILGIVIFYASWRMHTFRVGDDVVEVRSGILFRTHRRARLDRVQGVAISRPLFARIFGAAKLDVSVAGQDAKVQLSYLGSAEADRLRRDVLQLASGARAQPQEEAAASAPVPVSPAVTGAESGVVNQRMREFLAPELDPDAAPPESVVRIPPVRLILSLVLSGFTVALIVVAVFVLTTSLLGRREFFFILIIPGLAAAFGYYFNRFTKSLRYSIAATPDGVRVGFGLLSTSNDTLPPGRIHAIEVSQPLLWRPVGWWMIRINRAGAAGESNAQTSTTMLPVGTVDDVRKVLGLLLPGLAGEQTRELVLDGLVGRSGRVESAFTDAPRRAWPLRPFSWRRTGYARSGDAVLVRSGFLWRHLSVVPLARVQSVRITQGPVRRRLDLVELTLQTVSGPVRASVGVADRAQGTAAFEEWSAGAVRAAAADRSHRWAEGER
ncbi:MAG: hypothetical protein EPO52_06725 [Herbiconiux sp.]|uniref:PH domain-containing protein n=1 Tax=Herbiconiux sp. TaxID=1871186 RepID=UPI00120B2B28|nr:PH domain-containing protein [Herbiconiux sp.]TAJ47886.1 MAG: hypothetical protein EPO52_06725 [Herbiconiux sp.]